MKTYKYKDLRRLPARLQPSNDTGYTLSYFYLLSYFLFLSSFHPPLSCVSNTFVCLTAMLLHQTQTATQSCSPVFYLHLFFFTSLSLWISGTITIHPEDSPTPAALSNNFSFSHTPVRLGRVEVLVVSFLTIGNTQFLPHQLYSMIRPSS